MKKLFLCVTILCLFSVKAVCAETLSSGRTYIIRSAMDNNYVVDAYWGVRNELRENIQLYHYHGGDNQQFIISSVGNGWYKIVNVKTNKAVDVAGGVAGDEVNIRLWDQNNTDAQLFKFENAGNGYYYIKNKLGYYWDVYWGECRDEANIQTCRKNGGNNQKWLLTSIGSSTKQTVNNTKQQYLRKYNTAMSCMAQVQRSYMQAMQSKIKTTQTVNPENSGVLERLTQEIRKVNSGVGEEYCKAFALAILEDVEKFSKNNTQKTYNIYNQRGLNEFFSDIIQSISKNVFVDGKKFYCKGTVYLGAYSNITVRKQSNSKTVNLSWVKTDKEVKKICADYFERLKAINDDAWGKFKDALRDDLGSLIAMSSSVLNETVIRALCKSEVSKVSQKAMRDVLNTFKKFTEVKLGNQSFKDYMVTNLWNTFKGDLKSTVENGVDGGSDFIDSAEKIAIAQDKLQVFKDVLDKNSSDSNIKKAWEDFKYAYEVMAGSGVFGNWWFGKYVNDPKKNQIYIPSLDDLEK